jgi:outer membrane protein assembly factor BamB
MYPLTKSRAALPLLPLALILSVPFAGSEEWPRFRGPNGSGVSGETRIPVPPDGAALRWTVDLPGIGHGSPVIREGRLFVLCATEASVKGKGKKKGKSAAAPASPDGEATAPAAQRWMPLCLSTKDGSVLWRDELSGDGFSGHRFNSPASTTPAVDDKRVVFTWGTAERLSMTAYSPAGKRLWESDLGPIAGGHGFAASPVLLGDLVILNNDQEDEKGNLLAVDANTGEVRWSVPRRSKRISYAVPCVIRRGDRDLLVFTNWTHGFTVIDARDGSLVSEQSVFKQETNERAISSPVVYRDLVIGTCGFTANPKHCVAMRIDEAGQLSEAWRVERNVPHIPSVLVVGERCYLWDDAGVVTCLEAATGRELWKGRVPGVQGPCMGSPVSDGHTLCGVDESGNLHAIAAGAALKPLGSRPLGDLCRSTPAFGDGAMFIRTYHRLFALEGGTSE